MTASAQEEKLPDVKIKKASTSTFTRVSRFMGIRIVLLLFTVVVGVYLTILIANMGGYVDEIMRNEIKERVNMQVAAMTANQPISPEIKKQMAAEMIALEEARLGLDTPFVIRSFRYLGNALQLKLGSATRMVSDSGSRTVRLIILERLPATLLLMGSSQLFLFFFSVFIALKLSRSYGSIWDKIVITLSPSSSVPPWFYGIFLILLFAAMWKILPFGGMISAPPPEIPGNISATCCCISFSGRFIDHFFTVYQYLLLAYFFPDLLQ